VRTPAAPTAFFFWVGYPPILEPPLLLGYTGKGAGLFCLPIELLKALYGS